MSKGKRRTTPSPSMSSVPPERTSHTSVRPEERAVTSSRAVQLREVPAVWLDRFLVAITELPAFAGEEATVAGVVDALSAIVEGYAVGACVVVNGRQVVVRRLPLGDEARAVGIDPTRLFPGYTHERIFPLADGSTIHVAGDDPTLEDDRTAVPHIARRAAAVMDRCLERAREHSRLDATLRELRTLESHVIQADKLASFGQIAAGMVHELNNPLTSIVAYTDYLIRKFVQSQGEATMAPDDVDRMRRIGESANRMLRFTRDLVSYARPSSEVAVPVVVHTVIDQAVAFCEHLLAEAGAKVTRRYGEGVLTVRARPEQLAQVFVNLITNACHAMPPQKGELAIVTRVVDDGKWLEIHVEDNGHGIAEEHLPHIFAPFFTTKREGRGTGLGLSIVKSILDQHDGRIAPKSPRDDGTGTSFVIRLPAGPR
jgi:signal transduction histidine kinase